MSYKVSFIGLGVMGYPMAGHLARAGHTVTVYNRTSEKAQKWSAEYGGRAVFSPAAAAEGSDFVFCCVGNDDDLRSVTTGANGAFGTMPPGSVFVDHTTTSAEVARELAGEAKSRDFAFIDAPVSGGQAGAENGQLTVMIGGEEQAVNRVAPLIDCYARMQARLGEA
ncbi:MAG: NAD(P)-dependent oxidoreductase, partial [Lysobacterales bacterium]